MSSKQKQATSTYWADQTLGRARIRSLAFKICSPEINFTGDVWMKKPHQFF
jgi:hypothetical protein